MRPKPEKVVAGKQLRLAVEIEEERRTRMENDAAILKVGKLCLSFKLDTTERNRLLSAFLILLYMCT